MGLTWRPGLVKNLTIKVVDFLSYNCYNIYRQKGEKLMNRLIYTNELKQAFDEWLATCGFDVKTELSTDFAYGEDNEIIYFGFFITENSECVWNKLVEKWGLKTNYGTFVGCFLHELGHHHTLYLCSNFEYVYSMIVKQVIKILPFPKLRNRIYFSLPIEKIATQWAIHYMNTHPYECEWLKNLSQTEINKFMELNEVEDFM